jgi:hypothetical protein
MDLHSSFAPRQVSNNEKEDKSKLAKLYEVGYL